MVNARSGLTFFAHEEDQENGDRARDDREREQRAVFAGVEQEKERRDRGPDYRARMIHGAMKPIDLPPRRGRGPGREHGVPRGTANALADAIDHAHCEHVRPALGQRNQRPNG
jgi:hypothetical protein